MTRDLILPDMRSAGPTDASNPDVYARLLKDRIVFLGTQVDQNSANLVCAQLILLEAEDRDTDISLYINSPGGSVHRRPRDLRHDAVRPVRPSRRSASGLPPRWGSSSSVPVLRASGTRSRTRGS